jgi:hypothetical protein
MSKLHVMDEESNESGLLFDDLSQYSPAHPSYRPPPPKKPLFQEYAEKPIDIKQVREILDPGYHPDILQKQPPLPLPDPRVIAASVFHEVTDCPYCDCKDDAMDWVYVRSPGVTWQNLCGREGWLGYCPEHGKQMCFVLIRMN